MSKTDNGGPAFPMSVKGQSAGDETGMTLRDYFAAAALSGVMDVCRNDLPEASESRAEGFARAAYFVAEAMLRERAK